MPSASADRPTSEARGERGLAVRDAFEDMLSQTAPEHELRMPVAADVRRSAFENFERTLPPGGKPGRDWKHDYARVAAELPWHDSSAGPVETRPLLASDFVAAFALLAGPLVKISCNDGDAQGLSITALRELATGADIALRTELFGSAVRWFDDKFASLAVAFMQNGLLVHVAAGARIERPILIAHGVGGILGSSFPYTLVVLEEGAQATVVEDVIHAGFSCGIVEVVARGGATLDYVVVQRAEPGSTVLMNRGAVCDANATCRFRVAELGGKLSRSVVTTRLAGRGASADVAALFFNDRDQHVDLGTFVDHATGDTTSRTSVKSAATGRGQGRYFGNIRIEAHANGSDASLRDDALLLSKRAHIDSVPALEIASNDVKAFHGATVGSIDEAELFYAQSRGIERSAAERMIALGFFEPVVAAFPFEPVREVLRESLQAKTGRAALTEVS